MDLQPTALGDLLDDLDAEHEDLDRLVKIIGESDWDLPTPAVGWAVRDQISHLAFFDDAAVSAMTTPTAFAALVDSALASADPMEEHLGRGRALTGSVLLAWWQGSREALVSAARGLPDGARVPWFGPPMGSLSFVSARLMETWAHGEDVADALGVHRVATKRLRHIAHLGVMTRPFSYAVRGLELPPSPVDVVLTGPADEHWAWGDAGGDSVRGSALDFCLVVTQRRNVSETDLVVEGDAADEWMAIAQAFAGPPGPGRPPKLRA